MIEELSKARWKKTFGTTSGRALADQTSSDCDLQYCGKVSKVCVSLLGHTRWTRSDTWRAGLRKTR